LTQLHVHEWGQPDAPVIVCLHGVSGHGRRFRKLAEERLAERFRVLALDLRGHGRSTWEPPWGLDTHLDDVIETVDAASVGRPVWLGHSFGGRLILELARREPDRIERAVLLDPAIQILPHVAFDFAEAERKNKVYATAEEAIEARVALGREYHTPRERYDEEMAEHLERSHDGLLRYRYCQSAVVTGFAELAREAPDLSDLDAPVLVVVADRSWLVLDEQVEGLRSQLGDHLEVATVPGGHIVLWDSFDQTADAIETFLDRSPSP
jgi:lipase